MTTITDNAKFTNRTSSSSMHGSNFSSGKRIVGHSQSNLLRMLAANHQTISKNSIRIDTDQTEVITPAEPGSNFNFKFPPVYDDQGQIIS